MPTHYLVHGNVRYVINNKLKMHPTGVPTLKKKKKKINVKKSATMAYIVSELLLKHACNSGLEIKGSKPLASLWS